MSANVTLSDVARAAGVSLATASRAVNGNIGRGGRSTDHQRIAKIAAELGYVPDASAQAIARGRTSLFALVVSDMSDPAITNTLYDLVAAAADANGLTPSMSSAAGSADLLVTRVKDMHRQRARGLVVAAVNEHDPSRVPGLRTALDAFSRSGGSACTLGFTVDGTSSVTFDEEGGARTLASLIVSAGYRRPGIVCGSSTDPVHVARRRGLLAGFADGGHPVPAALVVGDVDEYTATRDMLAVPSSRPDVIVCVSPLETPRVVDAVLDSGLATPGDVAMAVCGDTATSTQTLALTRMTAPWSDAAEKPSPTSWRSGA